MVSVRGWAEGSDGGGAIALSSSEVLIEESTFIECNGNRGGAIWTDVGENRLTVRRSTFMRCGALDYSGALYLRGEASLLGFSS